MPNSSNNNKLQGCRPVHFWKVKKLNDCHDATLYKAYLHVVDRRIFVLVFSLPSVCRAVLLLFVSQEHRTGTVR